MHRAGGDSKDSGYSAGLKDSNTACPRGSEAGAAVGTAERTTESDISNLSMPHQIIIVFQKKFSSLQRAAGWAVIRILSVKTDFFSSKIISLTIN